MDGFSKPWYFAAGWAIDLYLNKNTRNHDDVELAIYREDQQEIHELLGKHWRMEVIKDRKQYLWQKDDYIGLPHHQIHVKNPQTKIILFDIFLLDNDKSNWIFRRNKKITMDIEKIYRLNSENLPYLTPEINLLFKAKEMREKDIHDFNQTLGYLGNEEKSWLLDALRIEYPGSAWIKQIEEI